MNSKNLIIAGLVAATAMLATMAGAYAQNAQANTTANVRSGPGTNFAKIDTLYAGEPVTAESCGGGWCFINNNGNAPDGYVSQSLLSAYNGPAPAPSPGPSQPDIPFNFGVTVGPGGPSISFGLGDAPPPPAPPVSARACFYSGSNFAGNEWCVNSGVDLANLPGSWNNTISSVLLFGGASVEVCKNSNFAGSCTVYTDDEPTLGSFNNTISSLEVF